MGVLFPRATSQVNIGGVGCKIGVKNMKLYHGSKSGIKGDIQCNLSRDKCDFGPGFYMEDKPEQPMGLIAGWETHRFYEMEL